MHSCHEDTSFSSEYSESSGCCNESQHTDENSTASECDLSYGTSSDEEHNQNRADYGSIAGRNQPIYNGPPITESQSLLLLMAFLLKHDLTDEALDDFLSVMNAHLPNVVPSTKHLFYKKFHYKAFTKHYFCADCHHYFGAAANSDPGDKCSCLDANTIETAKKQKWHFSYWNVQSQLELLLQDGDIAQILLNRTEPVRSATISDCVNGQLFQHLKEQYGYGSNDISLLWNADGVPVFR